MAVKMATLTACHHSAQKKLAATHDATQTDDDACAAPATGLVNPQFSTSALEAPQVVDSFPLSDDFAAPMYNQVRNKSLRQHSRMLFFKKFHRFRLWSGYRNKLSSPSKHRSASTGACATAHRNTNYARASPSNAGAESRHQFGPPCRCC